MKFVTARLADGPPFIGVLEERQLHRLTHPELQSMQQVVEQKATAMEAGRAALAAGNGVPVDSVNLLAPLPAPPRIFCIGLNYASHAAESQMKVQEVPTVFMKLSSSVVGHGADVVLPYNSTQPDYEAELAVVIGTPGYRIRADQAAAHIFGYTILNDVSARDVQLSTSQWTLGKSFPTFTPLGPALVTADELTDPHALDIQLTIGGELLQSSNTRHLIFRIPQLIEYISSCTPLQSGDIISTGTPEGVGLGRKPQRWLRPGETMSISIEGLGELVNRTVAETRS